MARFNLYTDLIKPVVESLQSDSRFAGVKVFYDRTEDRRVPVEFMPAINVFLEAPWEDVARGSVAYSLQTRRLRARMGFGLWAFSDDAAKLDEALFDMTQSLLDFFRDLVEFNKPQGIAVVPDVPLRMDFDYQGDENGMVGTHRVSVEFDALLGAGH